MAQMGHPARVVARGSRRNIQNLLSLQSHHASVLSRCSLKGHCPSPPTLMSAQLPMPLLRSLGLIATSYRDLLRFTSSSDRGTKCRNCEMVLKYCFSDLSATGCINLETYRSCCEASKDSTLGGKCKMYNRSTRGKKVKLYWLTLMKKIFIYCIVTRTVLLLWCFRTSGCPLLEISLMALILQFSQPKGKILV